MKDFVHHIKPALQENHIEILRMGVSDCLKLGPTIDPLSKDIMNIANQCINFDVKQIIISGSTFTMWLNASFVHHLNNPNKVFNPNKHFEFREVRFLNLNFFLLFYNPLNYKNTRKFTIY